jgi:hypothetical protein
VTAETKPVLPVLAPEDRRRIASRTILLASVIAAIGFALVAALFVLGETRVALGILAGHLIALACALSWILGAIVTFDGPFVRFARATIGLAPFRLALVAASAFAIAGFGRPWIDLVAFGVALATSQLLLQVVQGWCFMRLADASSPYKGEGAKVRFGGLRLFR